MRPISWGLVARITLVLASVFPVARIASGAEEPRELLREMATAYKSLGHYADQGDFVVGLTIDGQEKLTTQPARISLSRPNRVRIETGLVTLVSDGENLTTLVGPAKKYATDPSPKTIQVHHIAEGPAGSLLFGGPGGPPFMMVVGLLLGEDPARAIQDVGGELAIGPNATVDGLDCRVLSIKAAGGTSYRLFVDPGTKLVRAIDVSLPPEALSKLLPLGDRLKLTSYRWRSGPIRTDALDKEAFAVALPKDFTKIGAPAPAAEEPPAEARKFQVQAFLNKPAPAFSVTVLDGPGKSKTLTRADLAGKVVLIDFWATWCGPCLAELPEVQTLIEGYSKAKKDVVIVAISQDNDPKDPVEVRKLVETTLEKQKLSLMVEPVGKVAIDPEQKVGDAFKLEGYPTVVLLDREGVVRAVHVGFTPNVGKTLGREIDTLLDGKPIP